MDNTHLKIFINSCRQTISETINTSRLTVTKNKNKIHLILVVLTQQRF